MGSALHKAIEYHYAKPHKGSAQKVFYNYMTRMYDWWHKSGVEFKEYESFGELLKTGKHILETFPWDDYEPIAQELSFELPFSDHTRIKGYIDMIDSGGFVDFKSSKNTPINLNTDIQFMLYAWAYYQLYGVWPKDGTWHHLRTNEQFYFTPNKGKIESTITELKTLAETIYADTFEDIQPCAKCPPWCKFKKEIKNANIVI